MPEPTAGGEERFADAVIVAAGSSRRMAGRDKLLVEIGGRTVLERSVAAVRAARAVDRVIVVTRPDRRDEVARLPGLADVECVTGGAERSDSVRAGVMATSAAVVLIHDAARPLASSGLVDSVAAAAAEHGAAVPVLPVVDSLKHVRGDYLERSLDRAGVVRSQTPQGVRREILIAALEESIGESFSDEAALLEARGIPVVTVPGEAANMKITEPADLELARLLIGDPAEQRIGFGQDTHGFGPEDGLWLGGVLVEGAPRLYGHSDGDVVLHSVATAVLSAAGLGDVGRLFPPTDPSTRGIASAEVLGEAMRRVAAAGWEVRSVQISLIGARPRLGGQRIDTMRASVAGILGVGPDSVSIVASSGNLSGPEGAGRVISASALVVAHRR